MTDTHITANERGHAGRPLSPATRRSRLRKEYLDLVGIENLTPILIEQIRAAVELTSMAAEQRARITKSGSPTSDDLLAVVRTRECRQPRCGEVGCGRAQGRADRHHQHRRRDRDGVMCVKSAPDSDHVGATSVPDRGRKAPRLPPHQKPDGRSASARRYRAIKAAFESEIGGDLSPSEAGLVEQAAMLQLRSRATARRHHRRATCRR